MVIAMKDTDKQKLLLRSIFRSCGGPTELQELTGIPRQNFTNWQVRGKVPLLQAVKISKLVGISKWGLNYTEFCEVTDEECSHPSWEEVVESYFLPKGIIDKLLKGETQCQKEKPSKKKKKKRPVKH
jgi:hypothetical protein